MYLRIIDVFGKDRRRENAIQKRVADIKIDRKATIMNIIIPNDDQIIVSRFDGQVFKYTTTAAQEKITSLLRAVGLK